MYEIKYRLMGNAVEHSPFELDSRIMGTWHQMTALKLAAHDRVALRIQGLGITYMTVVRHLQVTQRLTRSW